MALPSPWFPSSNTPPCLTFPSLISHVLPPPVSWDLFHSVSEISLTPPSASLPVRIISPADYGQSLPPRIPGQHPTPPLLSSSLHTALEGWFTKLSRPGTWLFKNLPWFQPMCQVQVLQWRQWTFSWSSSLVSEANHRLALEAWF